jgi:hypothetical protein
LGTHVQRIAQWQVLQTFYGQIYNDVMREIEVAYYVFLLVRHSFF